MVYTDLAGIVTGRFIGEIGIIDLLFSKLVVRAILPIRLPTGHWELLDSTVADHHPDSVLYKLNEYRTTFLPCLEAQKEIYSNTFAEQD